MAHQPEPGQPAAPIAPDADASAKVDLPPRPSGTAVASAAELDQAEAPVIQLQDAGVRFGDFLALQAITLRVPAGALLGVIGPSGAGKTTAVRILTGGLRRSSGRAAVLGEDPERFTSRTRGRIGYMPQLFSLYPDLTAQENADFVASLFGLLFLRRRRRVRQVLQLVDLWEVRRRRAGDLSGGMQRRLELACALVHDPAVVFLDEPTAGLDPILRRSLWDELHRLQERGRTILVTTQYVAEAEECDAVALISEGRLVALAAPDQLRRMATGGDVLDLETSAPIEAGVLAALPMVRDVDQRSSRRFLVTVDDAGTASPAVVSAVESAGATVASSREYRPSFEDVFAALVGRHRRSLDERAATELLRDDAAGPRGGLAA